MLGMLGVPASAQVLIRGDVVEHEIKGVQEKEQKSEADNTSVQPDTDAHETHVALNNLIWVKSVEFVGDAEEVNHTDDGSDKCVEGSPS